ncbi:MAG: M60 family metallopeptidase [Alistipes sp.]|nr:M60 family metallopeptidase [Alistipes sp.]
MKKFWYIFTLALTLFTVTSCSDNSETDEEPIPTEISVSKESILVNKGGTTSAISVNVTCSGDWKYTLSSSGSSWCTVTRPLNSNKLNITVSPNTKENAKARTTTISVYSVLDANVKKSITIKQAGPKDGIVVEQTTHAVTPRDSILAVEVLANVDYEVETDEESKEWFAYVKTEKGDGSEELVKFSIAKNPTKSPRKANVTLTSETSEKVKITINQAAGGIFVDKTTYEAPSRNSDSFEVEINAYAEIDDIQIEEGKDWIKYIEFADTEDPYKKILKFSIDKNTEKEERSVKITIVSEKGDETTFTITQNAKDSVANVEAIGDDVIIKVDDITSSASGSYGDTVPKNLIDGDLDTYYSAAGDVSEMPVSLTCKFNDAERIDYVDIVPGRVFGKWGEVDVYVTTEEKSEYLYGSYDLKESGDKQRIIFEDGILNPRAVRFAIKTANMWTTDTSHSPTLIAAHEITFYMKNPAAFDMLTIFTDQSYSELREGITEADIDGIENEFFYNLASEIYAGEYDTKYRAATYKPYPHPDIDAKKFRTSTYSLNDNVTGMYFEAGEHVVFVNETYGVPISLRVIDYQPDDTMAEDSPGWCNEDGHYYPLTKGQNKINVQRRGLIYVMYHTEDPNAKPIKVNFPTALINKYYDLVNEPDADWATMLKEAKADHIDMVGKHTIFTLPVEWVEYYCDTPAKAKQIIQQADSITFLQEQIQGHHKYNTGGHRNRMLYSSTMAKAFMFAGAYRTGYSLRYGERHLKNKWYGDGTISMLLNPKKFRVDGWGAYHEVGHVNQLPGFKWTGMAEVTNNFTAMYCAHYFIGDNYPKHKSDYMLLMSGEWYDENGTRHNTSNRYDAAWQCFNDNGKKHAFSGYVGGDPPGEAGPGIDPFFRIVPFWQLYLYNTLVMGREDFYPDVYHQCRVGNLPDGSPNVVAPEVDVVYDSKTMTGGQDGKTYKMSNDGERQMNFIRLCCDAAQEDLTEFFEQWGMMTPFYGVVVDYGDHILRITPEMVQEVYDYAKKYPKPAKNNIWFMNNYNLDKYRSGDGSDVTGFDIPADIDECDGRYLYLYNGMQ